jgi:hypothetical protein
MVEYSLPPGEGNLSDTSRVYIKSPDIVHRKIAGEMVLVPIRHNVGDLACIYNLNEVGSRIWELLNGGITIAQIRDKIVEEYEVTPEEAEADVKEFLSQLEGVGAVSMARSGTDSGGKKSGLQGE